MPKRLALALLLPLLATPPETSPYSFPLEPTTAVRGARGEGSLDLAWSPFGLAVSPDGYVAYDLSLRIDRLPDLAGRGANAGYVAWISDRELSRVDRLGSFGPDRTLQAPVSSWNKFIVLVTAERDTSTTIMEGTLVLRGISPSGLMASFQSHELFSDVPD